MGLGCCFQFRFPICIHRYASPASRIFYKFYYISASSDNFAKLWNVKTGTLEREYAGHQKAVTALAFRDASIE